MKLALFFHLLAARNFKRTLWYRLLWKEKIMNFYYL